MTSFNSELPNVLENIVGEYTNTTNYPKLIELDSKIHTSDKLFIKTLGNVPRSQITAFADIYTAAVKFINKYFPYNSNDTTKFLEDNILPYERNFRIDPKLVN
jgi:hypothetical protein